MTKDSMFYDSTFLFQLNVTRRCNLRCEHCYISSEKKDVSPDWDADDMKHVVGGIRDHMLSDWNGRRVYTQVEIHVIGGEPTELGEDYFITVLPIIKKILSDLPHKVKLVLVTNLLTKQALEIAKMFDMVQTSYEIGTRLKKKRHMEMWLSNVQEMHKHFRENGDGALGITSAITKNIVEYGARNYIDLLISWGFKNVHLGFFIPSGDGETFEEMCNPGHEDTSKFLIEAFDAYLELKSSIPDLYVNPCESWIRSIKENRSSDDILCPIISGSLDIDGDGETISCIEKGGVLGYKSNGNVLERIKVISLDDEVHHYQTNISDILQSPSYRREVAMASMLPKSCIGCEFSDLCRGNCSVLHSQWNGDGECPGYKKFLTHVKSHVNSEAMQEELV